MSSNNKKIKFDEGNKKLITDIASQYIEIYKIVKKECPKSFTKDETILMFIKTEAIFNSIQIQLGKKNRKKNRNGNNKSFLPKETKRTKEYYA